MVCPRCSAPVATFASICVQCGADLRPGDARTPASPGPFSNAEQPTMLHDGAAPTPVPPPGADDATILNLAEQPTGYLPSIDSEAQTVGGPRAAPALESGPLAVGQVFGGRYHIIRLLGVGGMGAVYQAWDEELGVAVAIKVIRPEIMADPAAARGHRAAVQARAAARAAGDAQERRSHPRPRRDRRHQVHHDGVRRRRRSRDASSARKAVSRSRGLCASRAPSSPASSPRTPPASSTAI